MLWLSNALICIFFYFIFTWAYCTQVGFLVVFTSATCKCTRFLFCLFVQVLNAQVFFVLQHAFSLQ